MDKLSLKYLSFVLGMTIMFSANNNILFSADAMGNGKEQNVVNEGLNKSKKYLSELKKFYSSIRYDLFNLGKQLINDKKYLYFKK